MEEWGAWEVEPDSYNGDDPEGDRLEDELNKKDMGPLDDPEGDRLEDELNKNDMGPLDDTYNESGDVVDPHGVWNTIPFGAPGRCRPRLLVVIDSDANIVPRLNDALAHLASCDGTHGVKTSSVMFYLTSFFPSWQSKWIACRAALEAALGAQQMNAPPIIRISVRRKSHHTFFTSEGRPAGGRDMLNWWRATDSNPRGQLRYQLRFVRSLNVEKRRNCRFVKGYNNQPPGLNGTNVLTFGDYGNAGNAIQQWRLRCYLVPGVPIGFAGRVKLHHPNPHPLALHNPPNSPGGDSDAWVAVNATDFLIHPAAYLDFGNLP